MQRYFFILSVLTTSLIIGLLVLTKVINTNKQELCLYDGNFYGVGEEYPAIDDCNVCICGENGKSTCTKRLCPGNNEEQPDVTCEYEGQKFKVGESVKIDSCNSCTCMANGDIACTLMACEPLTEN